MAIDRDLADQAVDLLATAIAELIEDDHDFAVTVGKTAAPPLLKAERLKALGQDATALAEAIEVLARRSDSAT
jgi:hypothetical protein